MNQSKMKFGTDGWRGIIAEDFTFENVCKVAFANVEFFKKSPKRKNGIVVGYDARFLSREFAQIVANVFAENNFKVIFSEHICTTPMVSLMTKNFNAAFGIIITASHNPPQYNGYKIKENFGGAAFPETINQIEKKLSDKKIVLKNNFDYYLQRGKIAKVDFTKFYIDYIRTKIDISAIKKSKVKILHDSMFGAGMNIMQTILDIEQIHNTYNPSFGGTNPEPIEKNLKELILFVKEKKNDIGIATDGDADRIGAIDEKGNFVDSHKIISLLLKYFVEEKKMRDEVVKSFSVSQMVDKQCKKYGLKLHITPIGFKHICKLMVEKNVLVGGEESGGIGVSLHLPERDGIYIGLLLCEIMAKRKMKLSELVNEINEEFGKHFYDRIDLHLSEFEKKKIILLCNKFPKKIGEFKVEKVDTLDGYKFYVKNGWLLVRASGTEPLIRLYAEGDSRKKVEKLLKEFLPKK